MILSFMPQSHSSSTEIQLGESPERGGVGDEKVIPRIRVCLWRRLETHFTLQKRPRSAQSVNKQRPTKPLCSFFSDFSFSPHLLSPPRLITPCLSAARRPALPPLARAKVERNKLPNLNEFTIIASPVVTEVGDLSLFNLSNLLLA